MYIDEAVQRNAICSNTIAQLTKISRALRGHLCNHLTITLDQIIRDIVRNCH